MTTSNPFTEIIKGVEDGTIIHKDNDKRFALIEDNHPEAAIHWMAITYEEGTTEELEQDNREPFLGPIDYAINTTKAQVEAYPSYNKASLLNSTAVHLKRLNIPNYIFFLRNKRYW